MQLKVIKDSIDTTLENKLFSFLSNFKYLNFWWIKNINQQNLVNYTLFEIKNYLKKPQSKLIIAEENNEIIGILGIQRVEWDTKYFGYPVDKIEHLFAKGDYKNQIKIKNKMLKLLTDKAKNKLKFIHTRVNTNDLSSVHSLEKNKFNLITAELMYAWYRKEITSYKLQIEKLKEPCKVRKYKEGDLPYLLDMAKYFTTNRLVSDYKIPPLKATGVYVEWIKNACNNTFSGQDEVLVGEKDKKIVAFTTTKINTSCKDILGMNIGIPGLVGVHPDYRGQNINPYIMIKAILSLFKKAEIVCAPSHITNITMINSEHKAGARLVETSYIFHRWIS